MTSPIGDVIQLPALGTQLDRAHDERVRAECEAEERARARQERADRARQLLALGCPRRIMEMLDQARTDSAPMCALSDVPEDIVVVLAGGVGIGKTTAALRWLLRAPGRPWFSSAARFARQSRYREQAWEQARVAVLDDLGVEYLDAKGSFNADLDELITHYHGQRKGLVITTNLTSGAFRMRYGERVASRIDESGGVIPLRGRDLRRRKESR